MVDCPACQKSLAAFRVRRRESSTIRFLPRHVCGRKHFARSERRIARCQRATEAQNAAKLSRKSGLAAFSTGKAAHQWWTALYFIFDPIPGRLKATEVGCLKLLTSFWNCAIFWLRDVSVILPSVWCWAVTGRTFLIFCYGSERCAASAPCIFPVRCCAGLCPAVCRIRRSISSRSRYHETAGGISSRAQ